MGYPETLNAKDLRIVRLVLDEEITEAEREAFEGMLAAIEEGRRTLSERQRAWVRDVGARVGADIDGVMDRWKRGEIPRGRDIETPAALRRENLPMKPPGRK